MENTNNIINKPLFLNIEELNQMIIDVINQSTLHPTILEMVIKNIYNEVKEYNRIYCEREKAEYEKILVETKTNNNDEESTEK